jgi:alpha-beta hydrolase superfamily lysophospholipase
MENGCAKEMTTFPNFYHEIFNEIGKERPFTALEDWLKKR